MHLQLSGACLSDGRDQEDSFNHVCCSGPGIIMQGESGSSHGCFHLIQGSFKIGERRLDPSIKFAIVIVLQEQDLLRFQYQDFVVTSEVDIRHSRREEIVRMLKRRNESHSRIGLPMESRLPMESLTPAIFYTNAASNNVFSLHLIQSQDLLRPIS